MGKNRPSGLRIRIERHSGFSAQKANDSLKNRPTSKCVTSKLV